MSPTPFVNALVVFALQIVLGLVAAWVISLTAGTGAFFLSGLGVSPWMLPLLIAVLAAIGFAVAVAGLAELGADLAKIAVATEAPQNEGEAAPVPLPYVLWPQAIAGLIWAALLAVFVAALPYYGGQFPRFAFFIQAAIFTVVFAGLALILRRALRHSLR